MRSVSLDHEMLVAMRASARVQHSGHVLLRQKGQLSDGYVHRLAGKDSYDGIVSKKDPMLVT